MHVCGYLIAVEDTGGSKIRQEVGHILAYTYCSVTRFSLLSFFSPFLSLAQGLLLPSIDSLEVTSLDKEEPDAGERKVRKEQKDKRRARER